MTCLKRKVSDAANTVASCDVGQAEAIFEGIAADVGDAVGYRDAGYRKLFIERGAGNGGYSHVGTIPANKDPTRDNYSSAGTSISGDGDGITAVIVVDRIIELRPPCERQRQQP